MAIHSSRGSSKRRGSNSTPRNDRLSLVAFILRWVMAFLLAIFFLHKGGITYPELLEVASRFL